LCVRLLPCAVRVTPGLAQTAINQRTAALQPVEAAYLAIHTCRMAKKAELLKPISRNVYKIASKAVSLGEVAAIRKGGCGLKGRPPT
jgi:hypothetical protein